MHIRVDKKIKLLEASRLLAETIRKYMFLYDYEVEDNFLQVSEVHVYRIDCELVTIL